MTFPAKLAVALATMVTSGVLISMPARAQHVVSKKRVVHKQTAHGALAPTQANPPVCVTPAALASATPSPTVATPLTAAALRADPTGTQGKTVQWDVRVFALQTADPLRKGLAPEEPYLLATGPGSENAVLYVAIPPSLLETARTAAAVAPVPVVLVATVRTGRSEPVGVPILDAVSLARR